MVAIRPRTAFVAISLYLMAPAAAADAGVPMIFFFMPALTISIVPIIALEAVVLAKSLHLVGQRAAMIATVSNLVSSFIGIPITWIALVAIQMATGGGSGYGIETDVGKVIAVTWQAPWLFPYESELDWMIPVAVTVLLVPFFLVSWWSEYVVTKRFVDDVAPKTIMRCVLNANLLTYSLLLFWPIGAYVFDTEFAA